MKRLGRKKAIKNEQFIDLYTNRPDSVSIARINELEEMTLLRILEKTKGKTAAFGWSGGKDSQVIRLLCEKAGILDCMWGTSPELEYPAFARWMEENKPEKLVKINSAIDYEWVKKHEDLIFPSLGKDHQKHHLLQQWNTEHKYQLQNDIDVFILGRRSIDGNTVGKTGDGYFWKNRYQYLPIADWTHEELCSYIYYNKIKMAPIYSWPRGFVVGTHIWPKRTSKNYSKLYCWNEIWAIDKSIILEASKYLESAKRYLQEREG